MMIFETKEDRRRYEREELGGAEVRSITTSI